MTPTTGYIYFAIKTEDPKITQEDFDKYISLKPTIFKNMHQRGQLPKATSWVYSTPKLTKPHCYEEIEKLISVLEPYKEELKHFKNSVPDAYLVLEVVLQMGDDTPGLNFSRRAITFINEVGAEIDCDIYP
jgi:hypothetical protein